MQNFAQRMIEIKENKKSELENSEFYAAYSDARKAYAELTSKCCETLEPLSPTVYSDLVNQRIKLNSQLAGQKKIEDDILEADKLSNTYIEKLRDLRTELFEKRKTFLAKITANNPYVSAELIRFGDTASLEKDYRGFLA
jgi:hypothetical protein